MSSAFVHGHQQSYQLNTSDTARISNGDKGVSLPPCPILPKNVRNIQEPQGRRSVKFSPWDAQNRPLRHLTSVPQAVNARVRPHGHKAQSSEDYNIVRSPSRISKIAPFFTLLHSRYYDHRNSRRRCISAFSACARRDGCLCRQSLYRCCLDMADPRHSHYVGAGDYDHLAIALDVDEGCISVYTILECFRPNVVCCRYVPFAHYDPCLQFYIADTSTRVPLDFCKAFIWMRGFFGPILSTCVADWLFLVRVNALYSWDRRVFALTAFMYFATIATGLSLIIAELLKTPVAPRPPGFPVPGCLATVPPNAGLALIGWVTALAGQCVYFCLTFSKFLGFAKQMKFGRDEQDGLRIFRSIRRLAPTMHLFFRDNTFYFAVALILQVLNLIFTVVMKDRALEQMGTAWMMAGLSVVSSRLILNLRDPRNTPGHVTTPWGQQHHSRTDTRLPIAFAPRHTTLTTTLGSLE